jgi:hypothetical protein
VGKAVDQLATDTGVDRRHEPEPETREPGREERHRDDPAADAELQRVLAHQLLVGDLVGAADLEHRAAVELDVKSRDEVIEHVLDRDRLRRGAHPARRDHHRQALDQLAKHFEGEAARADHDRGPELDRLHARVGENVADFLATREVARELAACAEPAEVDDPAYACLVRSGGEVGCAAAILLLEARRRGHRMDEVVGGLHPAHRRAQRLEVEDVACDDRRRVAVRGDGLWAAGQAAHSLPALSSAGRSRPPT